MKKIKIGSMSPTALMIMVAVASFIAVPVRTYQLCNCIDPKTGFWFVKDFSIIGLYVLCGIVVLLSFFFSFFAGIMPRPEFREKRDIPVGVTSLILATTFLVDSVSQIGTYILLYQNFGTTNETFGRYIMSSGALPLTLQSLFGIISALYFVIVAYSYIKGENVFENSKFIALSPVLWAICRMIYHFVEPISYKNVSQLLLELMLIVFTMVFYLSFARIASKVNEESSMWILYFSGSAGTFFGFVCALAPLALIVTGHSDLIAPKYPLQYPDLAFAIFATTVLIHNLPKTVDNNTDEKPHIDERV